MANKISKETSKLFSRALLSLITGFVFVSIYFEKQNEWELLIISLVAFASGIYFLNAAYHKSKKEL